MITYMKHICDHFRHRYSVCRNHNLILSSFMACARVEQKRFAIQEHVSSVPVCRGVIIAQFSVYCVVFCTSLFVIFSWQLCSVLRLAVSNYPLNIFKPFLKNKRNIWNSMFNQWKRMYARVFFVWNEVFIRRCRKQ